MISKYLYNTFQNVPLLNMFVFRKINYFDLKQLAILTDKSVIKLLTTNKLASRGRYFN